MKINYQKLTEKIIEENKNKQISNLLLHSCCAPCSSYVIEYLSEYFNIYVFFYNPNITEYNEYIKRMNEQKRFIKEFDSKNIVKYIDGKYDVDNFFSKTKLFKDEKEGGKRCKICYRMRLEEAAKIAKQNNCEYFTTTLTISPHKNAQAINQIGSELEQKYGIKYLYSDFKKKNGYKRSIELSKIYNLYRQNYCGCCYSKK